MYFARRDRFCSSLSFSSIGSVISWRSVSGKRKSTEALIPRRDHEKHFLVKF